MGRAFALPQHLISVLLMILNFYLRKDQPKGEMQAADKHNLDRIRESLKRRGVENANQLDYHEALTMLAKIVAHEVKSRK